VIIRGSFKTAAKNQFSDTVILIQPPLKIDFQRRLSQQSLKIIFKFFKNHLVANKIKKKYF